MYDYVGNRTVMSVTDSNGVRNHVYSYDNYDKAGMEMLIEQILKFSVFTTCW